MSAAAALCASLAAARREATADYLATRVQERITIEPPVWCHACGQMLTAHGRLVDGGQRVVALCPTCAVQPVPRRERRDLARRAVRELVEIARLAAWHLREAAVDYDARDCTETARVLRELADETNCAIERLRRT